METWIKVRVGLRRDPAVIRMSKLLVESERAIVGYLVEFWGWAQEHTDTRGAIRHVTASDIDGILERNGFSAALIDVGWLKVTSLGITIPRFERYLGDAASLRRERLDADAARKRVERALAKTGGAMGSQRHAGRVREVSGGQASDASVKCPADRRRTRPDDVRFQMR